MARDVYIAIMIAAHNGRGLRLTADETCGLASDSAIFKAAYNGLEDNEVPPDGREPDWAALDPKKERSPFNAGVVAPEDDSRMRRAYAPKTGSRP